MQLVLLFLLWILHYSYSVDIDHTQQTNEDCLYLSSRCKCSAKCISIVSLFGTSQNATCFGSLLPYSMTASVSLNGEPGDSGLITRLKKWENLKTLPKCWRHLQAFLCSVYLPPCNNSYISRTNRSLCTLTREHCPILNHPAFHPLPDFFNCSLYSEQCLITSYRILSKGKCAPPLVNTLDKQKWFRNFSGCGLQCLSPLHSETDYDTAHAAIATMAVIALIINLWITISFKVTNNLQSHLPQTCLFYIHVLFCIASAGWLLQLSPSLYRKISCRSDGSLRTGDPDSNVADALPCMIVFLMVYVSFMAALLYSCIFAFMLQSHLAYLNNLNEVKLKRLKSNDPNVSVQDTNLRLPISINQSESFALEERIIDKAENSASIKISPVKSQLTSYESSLPISELLSREVNTITVCGSKIKNIYLISVLPPIIIFIICLFLDLIDASPIHGVCFITNKKLRNKITNVFVPILLCFIIKFFFFIRAICFINVLRKICQTSTHDSDKTFAVKLAQTGFTLVVFLLTLVVILVVGISVELYNYFNKDVWEKSLEDYLLCELNKTLRTCPQSSEPCRMLQKPGIRLLLLQVSMYFALMFCYWTMLYKHSKSVTGSSIKQLIIRWNNRFTSDTSNKEANSFLSCEVPFSSWWDLGLFHSTHEKASSKLKENDFHLSGKGKKNEENLSKSSTSSLFQQGAREESETWRNSYHSELVSLGDSHLTVNSTNSMCMASTPGGTAPRQKRFENRRTRRRADRRKQRDRLSRAVSIVSCRSNSFGPNKSKTSLKSARSYNSYELVGGCWCETIRTRNVLINALRWANMMTPKLPHPNCTAGFSPPTQCQCTGCQPAPLPPAPVNNQSLVCHQPPQQMMPTSPLTLTKKPSAPERRDSDEYDSEDETVSILDFKQDDQNRIVSNGSGLEVPDNDSDSFCSDDEANSEYELKHGKDIEMLGDSNSRVAPQHKDI